VRKTAAEIQSRDEAAAFELGLFKAAQARGMSEVAAENLYNQALQKVAARLMPRLQHVAEEGLEDFGKGVAVPVFHQRADKYLPGQPVEYAIDGGRPYVAPAATPQMVPRSTLATADFPAPIPDKPGRAPVVEPVEVNLSDKFADPEYMHARGMDLEGKPFDKWDSRGGNAGASPGNTNALASYRAARDALRAAEAEKSSFATIGNQLGSTLKKAIIPAATGAGGALAGYYAALKNKAPVPISTQTPSPTPIH